MCIITIKVKRECPLQPEYPILRLTVSQSLEESPFGCCFCCDCDWLALAGSGDRIKRNREAEGGARGKGMAWVSRKARDTLLTISISCFEGYHNFVYTACMLIGRIESRPLTTLVDTLESARRTTSMPGSVCRSRCGDASFSR